MARMILSWRVRGAEVGEPNRQAMACFEYDGELTLEVARYVRGGAGELWQEQGDGCFLELDREGVVGLVGLLQAYLAIDGEARQELREMARGS